MKKYNVECTDITVGMIMGEEVWNEITMNITGDYTEANSPDEAIQLVKDWIIENTDCGYAEISKEDSDMVLFYDEDGRLTGGNAFFKATEIKD